MKLLKKIVLGGFSIMMLFSIVLPGVLNAQEIVQGYKSNETIRPGMIVGLSEGQSRFVEISSQDTEDKILGLSVDSSDAPFALSDGDSTIYVATVGNFDLLVSDDNGPIKAGDYVGISTLSGIGHKATTKQPLVVGKALGDFIPLEGSEILSQVTSEGDQINIGRIKIEISVIANPTLEDQNQNVPSFLRTAADTIGDKPISLARIYLAVAIILLTTAVSGSIVYAAVRSGITAIGRNPLSRKSITRSLIQSVLVALIVLMGGLFMAFLTIRFS